MHGRNILMWDDNIKMYLKETRCEDVKWLHLDQEMIQWRGLVNAVMNLRFF